MQSLGRLRRRCATVAASYEIGVFNSSYTTRDCVDVRTRSEFAYDGDGLSRRRPVSERVRGCSLQKLDYPTSSFYAADHKPRLA